MSIVFNSYYIIINIRIKTSKRNKTTINPEDA